MVDNKQYSWLSFRKGGPYNATITGIDNNYLIIFDIAHQGDEDFEYVLPCCGALVVESFNHCRSMLANKSIPWFFS